MRTDARTVILTTAIVILVGLGLVWVASDLRKQNPEKIHRGDRAEEATRLHPDLDSGLQALRAGEMQEALDYLGKVPETDPGYTLALMNRGQALQEMGDLEAALQSYGELVKIQPGQPDPYVHYGRVLFLQGKYRDAEVYALRALELTPSYLPARYAVALARVADGRIDEAVPAYARAMGMDRDGRITVAAEAELKLLAVEHPEIPGALYALAYFENVRGNPAGEVDYLERFLTVASEGSVADNARSRLEDARSRLSDTPAD